MSNWCWLRFWLLSGFFLNCFFFFLLFFGSPFRAFSHFSLLAYYSYIIKSNCSYIINGCAISCFLKTTHDFCCHVCCYQLRNRKTNLRPSPNTFTKCLPCLVSLNVHHPFSLLYSRIENY